jgi:myo-inositol-1(or 4)-monophosphatase
VRLDLNDQSLLTKIERAASCAADAAANCSLASFRKPIEVTNKRVDGSFDPVTEADRATEVAIRQVLTDCFPEFGFYGEESGKDADLGRPHWVVDPIDGTRAYITGMPLWGTLIALNSGDEVVFGLIDQPFLAERYIGYGGQAYMLRKGEKTELKTRVGRSFDQAIVQATTPEMFATEQQRASFTRVVDAVELVRYGGDCYAYAMLAAGFVDLVIEAGLEPYDVQALIPVVEGAGGVITNWNGTSVAHGGTMLAAATPELHAAALELLNIN